MDISIVSKNMSIEFPIFENSHRSIKKKVLNVSTGGRIGKDAGKHPVVRALDNLNFEIHKGERVGLFGHNGSGKTTLLRTLSGVYSPVNGELITQGRIASLLNVSSGMDPDATGFENIYLRGIMDGLKPSAIKRRIEDIADFTELGEYLNLPVRTYSSGMSLRLAFAISTSINADIIIMDEWLSVGDAAFREKAQKRLKELIDKASIFVIATHDPKLIESICTRKIYLEHGRIISDEQVLLNEETISQEQMLVDGEDD